MKRMADLMGAPDNFFRWLGEQTARDGDVGVAAAAYTEAPHGYQNPGKFLERLCQLMDDAAARRVFHATMLAYRDRDRMPPEFYVDAARGHDAWPGTKDRPMRTVAELRRRAGRRGFPDCFVVVRIMAVRALTSRAALAAENDGAGGSSDEGKT